MTGADFGEFYAAVHDGRAPFPWQERLAERVLGGGGWPEVISIPTACGKTSVIDVAVFALAAQAGEPQRTAPMRIFFVVDRRLVVDDVTRHASELAAAVESATDGVVANVREQLRRFGGASALQVATLRGGMYRSDSWADAPNQPLVCVSTVDQVGSRLLFRGYGASEWRRPVDAGLVGTDSLIILDEAHLSQPFRDTLHWVVKYQGKGWTDETVASSLRVVEMSATGRNAEGAFSLEQDDHQSALRARLEARKLAELKEAANLEQTAVDEALRLAKDGAAVVGVVMNTVASARAAFELLRHERHEAILLTGRVRPYDRDRTLAGYLGRIKADRERSDDERLFVVATQTVEVGADLDFDALVTEAAPLDALRQRFGRLDRIGRKQAAAAVILKPKRAKGREWIYGAALDATWKWLEEHATSEQGRAVIDFGVRHMMDLFEREGNLSLNTEREDGPLMFPAHVEAWAQTSPQPAADPDVAPFLHGSKALEAADVQIVWRADLPAKFEPQKWIETVAVAPPVVAEALPLPIGLARRWLKGQIGQAADIEGLSDQASGEERRSQPRQFLIWRGPERLAIGIGQLRPGDTIIVPSREGGCDEFGWAPESTEPVRDIGDLCANRRVREGGGRYRLRVHPRVLCAGHPEMRQRLSELLDRFAADEDESLTELKELVWAATAGEPDLEKAAQAVDWRRRLEAYGEQKDQGLLVESKWVKPERQPVAAAADEADDGDASSLTREIVLSDHTSGVLEKVRQFATACGLGPTLTSTVAVAVERHDLGKWDGRFQYLLDPRRDPAQEPLAKGEKRPPAEMRRRRDLIGYPDNWRHEFASVAIAEALARWPEDCDRKLALYLIGTHHGHGRPFPPVWKEDSKYRIRAQVEGQAIEVEGVERVASLGSGWVDRFWALNRRYGSWGLAYLEAILRRADCVRSREEQEGKQ